MNRASFNLARARSRAPGRHVSTCEKGKVNLEPNKNPFTGCKYFFFCRILLVLGLNT